MEYITLLGGYMVAVVAALLVAARWRLKHDPALRMDPPPDSPGQPASPPGD